MDIVRRSDMKISKHGKKRLRERTELNHRERIALFGKALKYGKSPNDISDKELREYLEGKGNCKVKLYKGYVFIYSKNSSRMYTMYELPKHLKREEERR